ncbi:MAG: hypothetical protein P8N48_02290 [Bacteroidales bacterium]|jgi:YVTN family beta-propeller protein|nr:hypothetical protein [Bacteroidales bacterium]MDG1901654.1 hypothetical protein [Bacteroidales bacterium]MDG2081524.1 hypothetical protein [Bacteroidales bacterium]
MKKTRIIIVVSLLMSILACEKENHSDTSENSFDSGGVFILNEGNYSSANSSLSYYNPETDMVDNNVFHKINNVPLGDVAQSICLHNEIALITVNNSGILYSIKVEDAQFQNKINGLISPRYILPINETKAYVTDFMSHEIIVINLKTFEIEGSIYVGKTTENIIMHNGIVYTANWSAYNQTTSNNTIMVINPGTNEVIDSIIVGIEPGAMVIDNNNYLWVLCSGGYMNEERPSLWKINTSNKKSEETLLFNDINSNPTNLCINYEGDSLYFLDDGVYTMSVNDSHLPQTPLIESNEKTFYCMSVNTNGDIYLGDARDYNRNGDVYRYNINGKIISKFEVGIIPGDIVFID